MRIRKLSAILLLTGLLSAPLLAQETTRVTAGARKALQMLASIKVGAVEVTYVKGGDQSYQSSYTPRTRPEDSYAQGSLLGSDPEMEGQIAAEIARLAPFADKDGSGAVTAPEGLEFRRVLEFGMMAAWVSRTEETVEVKKLAPAPPSSSGTSIPIRPISKSIGIRSASISAAASIRMARSASSDSAKSRTASRNSRSSSERLVSAGRDAVSTVDIRGCGVLEQEFGAVRDRNP